MESNELPMLTFETKCYENDWEFVLHANRMRQILDRCGHTFQEKTVFINNVSNPAKVKRQADKLIRAGLLDRWIHVEDYAANILDFFQLEKPDFNGGYYYSIAELAGIYFCNTPFLLHFSSDSIPDSSDHNWIPAAMQLMDTRKDILVANATWDYRYEHAAEESFTSLDGFYLGYGFSDQCYLIRTADFRQPIYSEQHALSARYPIYGGELFEKRVDSYMRNHQLFRITSMQSSYVHRNYPVEARLRRKIKWGLLFNRPIE